MGRVVCRYLSAGAAGTSSGLPWRGEDFCFEVRVSAVWKVQEGSGMRGVK